MLTEDEAVAIAKAHLAWHSAQMKVELAIHGRVERTPDGFLVYYNTRAWIETQDINEALAGNLPFLVDYETGEVIEAR